MKFILPRFLVNIERWKWNDEYRIFVSNTGRFKDEYKKELPIKVNQKGYCSIKTYTGWKLAHRLVLKTWRPTRDMENLTIDHIDHNKRNNNVTNLEWVTARENIRRARKDFIGIMEDESGNIQSQVLVNCAFPDKVFMSYETAAAWCVAKNKQNLSLSIAKKKIYNSVNNGSNYFGGRWKWVEINE